MPLVASVFAVSSFFTLCKLRKSRQPSHLPRLGAMVLAAVNLLDCVNLNRTGYGRGVFLSANKSFFYINTDERNLQIKNTFSFISLNARSVVNKMGELRTVAFELVPDILWITES
ncbi:unnamed protein product [Schistocephalus solidus]|uniref:Lysosomal trafficking regulator lyst n=1 Tax=Schistocephalus solidus TaxID=70667 RepID=A0A183T501_SCHSO|nr:unnamed protein product [Schistocephalus solidus]